MNRLGRRFSHKQMDQRRRLLRERSPTTTGQLLMRHLAALVMLGGGDVMKFDVSFADVIPDVRLNVSSHRKALRGSASTT